MNDRISGERHPIFSNRKTYVEETYSSFVYEVPVSSMVAGALSFPSLSHYVDAVRHRVREGEMVKPGAWWDAYQVLGELTFLGPMSDEGSAVGGFAFVRNDPRRAMAQDAIDGQTDTPLQIRFLPNVVSTVVNGGVLLAKENVCFGIASNGLLAGIAVFVLNDEE